MTGHLWCLLDAIFRCKVARVCRRHEAAIMASVPPGEDWFEVLNGKHFMHHWETLPKADVVIKRVVFPQAGVLLDFTTGKVTPMPQTSGAGSSTTISLTYGGWS